MPTSVRYRSRHTEYQGLPGAQEKTINKYTASQMLVGVMEKNGDGKTDEKRWAERWELTLYRVPAIPDNRATE